ncbi:MAG TPA: SPOR domain-containing protein, partial [Burkholderiaceae bacterium]|nr:SPOR domain-containing protein [Burkholderiaceae bacterium]
AARGYGINVGLFADPANARRALVRIRQAGVPARSDTLQLERGQRTRVRAGPFANRAQAEQAAARIKALGLDAQVFKQGANE